MIYVTQSGESGHVATRKHPPTGIPENEDKSYAVRRCGPFWEVRCVRRSKGRIASDQLVAALPTEQEADALARFLVDPPKTRDAGKRTIEDIIEEDRDG